MDRASNGTDPIRIFVAVPRIPNQQLVATAQDY
jgi:hypothetical protein